MSRTIRGAWDRARVVLPKPTSQMVSFFARALSRVNVVGVATEPDAPSHAEVSALRTDTWSREMWEVVVEYHPGLSATAAKA
ncbi:MAG TPA: hypothetical protein PKY05_17985, partial [Fibrobacteria bacterium]|nr:hypothetical protein [Fibrobacteria bacterium]